MYDAIVIGARCGGAPTAMLLARQGHRVLLVDRARFPSDTMSTHFVHPPALVRLRRWGLLDALLDTGLPRIPTMRMDFGPIELTEPIERDFGPVAIEGSPTPMEGIDWYCAPRRKVLDKLLVDAAVESGAELREGTALRELVFDGDRVVGVRLGAQGEPETEERARLVVGADGMSSDVAKAVGAEAYDEVPSLTVGYYSYWSGIEPERANFTPRPGRNVAEFPTHDGQACVNVSWPVAEMPAVRKDIEGHVMRSIEEFAPELAERMRSGERAERFKGTGVVPNFFRKPHGPGWALVGDAGYHKDPIGAHGIMDALRDAELLADAAGAGLGGERPMEEALAEYQSARDAAAAPLYWLNVRLASLAPTPDVLALTGAVAANDDPEDTERFLGILAGTVPVPEFFEPSNVERILGEAGIPMSALVPG